jgi:cytochrome c-type biogenesis protein CcmH/NrfG
VVGVGLVLGVGAILVGSALDTPVDSGARDASQPIVVGPVVEPGQELTGGDSELPPLALVLDRPLPDAIAGLGAAEQIAALEARAADGDPQRLVELGVGHQRLSDTASAENAFRAALRTDPGNVAATAGLALTDAATGSDGQARAAVVLADLVRQNPRSQIALFNQGWLAVYRREPRQALDSWRRTVRLGASTPLGRTASELVRRLDTGP